MNHAMKYVNDVIGSLWSKGQAVISLFSLLIITPVVAFYLACDWDRMLNSIDQLIPVKQRETVRKLAREIDASISAYVHGQSAVCLILGSYYAIGLTLAGLNFGFLIGVVCGLISFIPYVGSLTALVVSLCVAFAQFFPEWGHILIIAGIVLVGQFIEGNVLSPKLVGHSVGLHPVWLMFALFAFGYLFGFVGLLLAVPLAAAIERADPVLPCNRYRRSLLYNGSGAGHNSHVLSPAPASRSRSITPKAMRVRIFCPGPCNEGALALIDSWPDWPARAVALVGPEGSGKTHLATIWAAAAGARVVSAHSLGETDLRGALATGALVVEDAAAMSTSGRCSISSILRARRSAFLLFTARTAPSMWPVTIPDRGFAAAGAAGRDAASARRRDAARGHRETRHRPPARLR